ncbi:MAG: zinc ribbon domain-containing protein [Candidatus Eremiobacteraeota bacterium]|nr:zinc ribbon domain-containing protein [Candidatus Eremiobacteraeota bacterium]
MQCRRCGADAARDARFCILCGSSLEPERQYCISCGRLCRAGARFCDKCGRTLANGDSQAEPKAVEISVSPTMKGQQIHEKRGRFRALPLLTVLFVIVGLFLLVLYLLSNTGSKTMTLGSPRHLTSNAVSEKGCVINVSGTGTKMDGLCITVPSGAYRKETVFELSMAEIKSHRYGSLFNAATPLISIKNGGGFSEKPITLRIPVRISDDEAALAFFYDRESGSLEGIPFAGYDSISLTAVTAHFSDVVVSKVKKGRIVDSIDTGFRPGTDDFQMPNYGSYARPDGHCAGQSIAAMFYYLFRGRIGWDTPLHGLFDNNGHESTPLLWQDDSLAIRLCSAVQHERVAFTGVSRNIDWQGAAGKDDEATYYAFAYAMQLTGNPQFMRIESSKKGGAHAIIAWSVTREGIDVADPNFPGKSRRILFERAPRKAFKPYSSGADAGDVSQGKTIYDRIGYLGLFALINRERVRNLWMMLKEGRDPGKDIFIPDMELVAATGIDSNGRFVTKPLKDVLEVNLQDMLQIDPDGRGELWITNPLNYDARLVFYRKDKMICSFDNLSENQGRWAPIKLERGKNDLGVLYLRIPPGLDKYKYVNFNRYMVNFIAPGLKVEPHQAKSAPGEGISFNASVEGGPQKPWFRWDYGDGTEIEGTASHVEHLYEKEGLHRGSVTLMDRANPSRSIGRAEFVVTVSSGVVKHEPGFREKKTAADIPAASLHIRPEDFAWYRPLQSLTEREEKLMIAPGRPAVPAKTGMWGNSSDYCYFLQKFHAVFQDRPGVVEDRDARTATVELTVTAGTNVENRYKKGEYDEKGLERQNFSKDGSLRVTGSYDGEGWPLLLSYRAKITGDTLVTGIWGYAKGMEIHVTIPSREECAPGKDEMLRLVASWLERLPDISVVYKTHIR